MNENSGLIDFWNSVYANQGVAKIAGKWIVDENFNLALNNYIKKDSRVIDYGCGSGWGLIEVCYTIPLKQGIGIDTSKNAVECANKTCQESNIDNLKFIEGNNDLLSNYQNYFDSGICINLIDVLPDEYIEKVLVSLSASIKNDGYLLIGINPSFPEELLLKAGYEIKDKSLYKNDVFRGNVKSNEEWKSLFSKHFDFVEEFEFALSENEKKFPRRMFVLKVSR